MLYEQQLRDYGDTLSWVSDLVAATTSGQLTEPTPCAQFDVRLLIGHLIGTARRGLGTAERKPTHGVPHVVTDVADQHLAVTYTDLAEQSLGAWSRLHEADPVDAPWGRCAAFEAARGFTIETLTHGWDLAVATG